MWALQVDAIYSSPLSRAKETAQSIADLQSLAGFSQPPVRESDDLNNRDWGSLEGREASEVPAVFLSAYEWSPASPRSRWLSEDLQGDRPVTA